MFLINSRRDEPRCCFSRPRSNKYFSDCSAAWKKEETGQNAPPQKANVVCFYVVGPLHTDKPVMLSKCVVRLSEP